MLAQPISENDAPVPDAAAEPVAGVGVVAAGVLVGAPALVVAVNEVNVTSPGRASASCCIADGQLNRDCASEVTSCTFSVVTPATWT